MNFDKAGSCGPCEAVEHLTVLKPAAVGSATVQCSPHDSETQYGRSRAEELRSGAEAITKGRRETDRPVLRKDVSMEPGCQDAGPSDGTAQGGLRTDMFLPPAER